MTVTITKKELFVVQTELVSHPVFYVTANSVVDAAKKAELIVKYYADDKAIKNITTMGVPLLDCYGE